MEAELATLVSMKSGLEDRNNQRPRSSGPSWRTCLNEVRPGRPEQLAWGRRVGGVERKVSMKSGLEDRNNRHAIEYAKRLNLESQ